MRPTTTIADSHLQTGCRQESMGSVDEGKQTEEFPDMELNKQTGDGDSGKITPGLSLPEDNRRLSDGDFESDSGQGSSDLAASGEAESGSSGSSAEAFPWQGFCNPVYNIFTAYSETMAAIMPGHAMIYEFEIPQAIVGRLIGRYGSFVNKIKMNTGANIIVKRHFTSLAMKRCAVEGLCSEIEDAMRMIRERFPLKRFPYLSLLQVNHERHISPTSSVSLLPSNNKLRLVEGVISDVTLCNALCLDFIFLQQPTHPTFPALSRLHEALSSFYEEALEAPKLLRPFSVGVICVVRLDKYQWYRAEVSAMYDDDDEVEARLVDVGGYIKVNIADLRQIRVDFVTIPFQAVECKLAQIMPINESGDWCKGATSYFNGLCNGQVLQAQVVDANPANICTLVYLYRMNGSQAPTFINRELVDKGYAKWIKEPISPMRFDEFGIEKLSLEDPAYTAETDPEVSEVC